MQMLPFFITQLTAPDVQRNAAGFRPCPVPILDMRFFSEGRSVLEVYKDAHEFLLNQLVRSHEFHEFCEDQSPGIQEQLQYIQRECEVKFHLIEPITDEETIVVLEQAFSWLTVLKRTDSPKELVDFHQSLTSAIAARLVMNNPDISELAKLIEDIEAVLAIPGDRLQCRDQ